MLMNCKFISKDRVKVVLPNGNDSTLFGTVFSIVRDFDTALDIYYVSDTTEFLEYKKGLDSSEFDSNGEVSLRQLMNYINYFGSTSTRKPDVIDLMKKSNTLNSKELLYKLARAETNGIFIFSKESLQNTNIFTNFEIENILRDSERQQRVLDLIKYLRQKPEFQMFESYVENSSELTPVGKIRPDYTIQSQSNSNIEVENNLEPDIFNSVQVDINRTINFDYNEDMATDINFLQNVSERSWNRNPEQIKTVLKGIEKSAEDNGINLRGLEGAYETLDREDIQNLLNLIEEGLISENSQVIKDAIYEFLASEESTAPVELDKDEVYISTNKSEEDMFLDHSLIKISDNLYKKVNREPLPLLVSKNANKRGVSSEDVLEDVNNNLDRSISDRSVAKEIYLLKSNLNIISNTLVKDSSNIDKLSETEYYTSSLFEEDFGRWLIRNNNSDFKITEKGIEFSNPQTSDLAFLKLPEYLQESIRKYSYVNQSINIPTFLDSGVEVIKGEFRYDRAKAIVNINSIPDFKGDYSTQDGTIIVRDISDNFLKINGDIYEIVSEVGNSSIYQILSPTSADILNTAKPYNENDLTTVVDTSNDKNETHKLISNSELSNINEKYFNC